MSRDFLMNNLIEHVEQVGDAFISENKHNKFRERFFPHIFNYLGYTRGVEVGVDKGAFSLQLLSSMPEIKELIGVDPYIDNFGSDHRPGHFDQIGENRYSEAINNLKEFIQKGKCTIVKDYSANASKLLDKESIDFVYIDGDHSLEGIYTDLYSWTPKVKIGGIVAGHDYKDGPKSGIEDYFGEQLPFHVKTVVDYFGRRYGYKIHPVGGIIKSFWFIRTH